MIKCNGPFGSIGKCVIDCDETETFHNLLVCKNAESFGNHREEILIGCEYAEPTDAYDSTLKKFLEDRKEEEN